MATNFPQRARRDDPNGHMVVQQMLEFLREAFDSFAAKIKSGTATIPQGATNIVVSHALGIATYAAAIVPLVDPGGRFWLSNKSPTAMQINLQVAAPVGGVPFDWIVKGG